MAYLKCSLETMRLIVIKNVLELKQPLFVQKCLVPLHLWLVCSYEAAIVHHMCTLVLEGADSDDVHGTVRARSILAK